MGVCKSSAIVAMFFKLLLDYSAKMTSRSCFSSRVVRERVTLRSEPWKMCR